MRGPGKAGRVVTHKFRIVSAACLCAAQGLIGQSQGMESFFGTRVV